MKQLIRKKAVSAALVGLASDVIVNTVNLASAHAASTTDNTTSTSGTTRSKNVLYVDEQGAVVGSGKITETSKSDGNGGTVFTYAVDKTIPAGYSVNYTPLKWGACPKTSTRTLVKRMRVGISHDVLYLNLRRYGRLAAGRPAVEVI